MQSLSTLRRARRKTKNNTPLIFLHLVLTVLGILFFENFGSRSHDLQGQIKGQIRGQKVITLKNYP